MLLSIVVFFLSFDRRFSNAFKKLTHISLGCLVTAFAFSLHPRVAVPRGIFRMSSTFHTCSSIKLGSRVVADGVQAGC